MNCANGKTERALNNMLESYEHTFRSSDFSATPGKAEVSETGKLVFK